MTTTSETLLHRLRRPDDHGAWRQFIELYSPLISRWARLMGLSAGDAEDLTQEVLTLLVRKLPDFEYDRQGSFRAWLRTITIHRGQDFFRRCGRAPRTVGGADLLCDRPGVDAWDEVEYRRYLVSRALDLMQQEFAATTWKACWECVVNDRPADEVALELGITANAVYIAKSRVLRRLREALAGLLD